MKTEVENEANKDNKATQKLISLSIIVLLLLTLFIGSLVALFAGSGDVAAYAQKITCFGSILFWLSLALGTPKTTDRFERGVLATETNYGRNLHKFVSKGGRFTFLDCSMIAFVLFSSLLLVLTNFTVPILSRVPTSLIVGIWISCVALAIIRIAMFMTAVWITSVRRSRALSVFVTICLASTATLFVLTLSTLQVGVVIALSVGLFCLYIPIFRVTVGDYPYAKQDSQSEKSNSPSDSHSALS